MPVTILIVSHGFSEAQCLTLNKQQWRTVVQPRGANTWTKFFASLLVMMQILLTSGKDEQQLLQDSRMLWPTVSKAALRSHITICCLQRKSCKSLEAYVNSLTASDFSKANVFKNCHYWDGFIFHSPRIAIGRKWRCGCDL